MAEEKSFTHRARDLVQSNILKQWLVLLYLSTPQCKAAACLGDITHDTQLHQTVHDVFHGVMIPISGKGCSQIRDRSGCYVQMLHDRMFERIMIHRPAVSGLPFAPGCLSISRYCFLQNVLTYSSCTVPRWERCVFPFAFCHWKT